MRLDNTVPLMPDGPRSPLIEMTSYAKPFGFQIQFVINI